MEVECLKSYAAWGKYHHMSLANKVFLKETLSEIPNGTSLYDIVDTLIDCMSMNNYIDHNITGKWLKENCKFATERVIDRGRPLAVLVAKDIIAINNDGHVMINPIYGMAVSITEDNFAMLQDIYAEFKATGKCNWYFNSKHLKAPKDYAKHRERK